MKFLMMLLLFSFFSLAELNSVGEFYPCPAKPNCVSTMTQVKSDDDQKRYMAPLKHKFSVEEAKQIIIDIIKSRPRTKVLEQTGDYIHIVEETKFFNFQDDVEFLFVNDTLHMKSASRKGYYDFGKNRDRLEEYRDLFSQQINKGN